MAKATDCSLQLCVLYDYFKTIAENCFKRYVQKIERYIARIFFPLDVRVSE